jgi:hypothetical protein
MGNVHEEMSGIVMENILQKGRLKGTQWHAHKEINVFSLQIQQVQPLKFELPPANSFYCCAHKDFLSVEKISLLAIM